MTLVGHRATGLGAAAVAFALAHVHGSPWPYWAALLAFPGATAPDWLEVAWFKNGIRHSLIKHRTWTHWLPLWLLGLYLSLQSLGTGAWWAAPALGFCVGGLTHLAMDIPNPSGIRILHPYRQRVSFDWWRGDQMVWPLVFLTWGVGLWSWHWAGLIDLGWSAQTQAWWHTLWQAWVAKVQTWP